MKLINGDTDKIRSGLNELQCKFPDLNESLQNPQGGSLGEYFNDEIDNQIFDVWDTVEGNFKVGLKMDGWKMVPRI